MPPRSSRSLFMSTWSVATARPPPGYTDPVMSVDLSISSIFIFDRIFSLYFLLFNRNTFAFTLFTHVFGRVSLSTGKSIFPRIFGPSNFSAFIFSITGGALLLQTLQQLLSCCTSSTGSSVNFFVLVFLFRWSFLLLVLSLLLVPLLLCFFLCSFFRTC